MAWRRMFGGFWPSNLARGPRRMGAAAVEIEGEDGSGEEEEISEGKGGTHMKKEGAELSWGKGTRAGGFEWLFGFAVVGRYLSLLCCDGSVCD